MKILDMLNRNEVGDAELFANIYPDTFCYDRIEGNWYKWGGQSWEEERAEGIVASIDEVVKIYHEEARRWKGEIKHSLEKRTNLLNTYQRRVNVMKLASAYFSQNRAIQWDEHPWKLPCANGMVDLRTGEIKEGRHEDFVRTVCPTMYRGTKVRAYHWEKFLTEIMGGNKEMVDYLRRLVGYVVSGTVQEHIFPILYGKGRNGKGTMVETLGRILGPLAVPVPSSLLLETSYSRSSASPSPDILRLRGKRLVWAGETDEGRRLSAAIVKWICGGDTLTGRPLYGKEDVSFKPTHTVFLLTNHKPQVNSEDYAIWQRIHLIPFGMSFVEEPHESWERKRDKELGEKLVVERTGILSWIVRGCMEWGEYGLRPPALVRDAIGEYKREEDTVGRFLEERCMEGEEKRVWASVLYEEYRRWCGVEGVKAMNGNKFGSEVGGRFERVRVAGGRKYKGIELETLRGGEERVV